MAQKIAYFIDPIHGKVTSKVGDTFAVPSNPVLGKIGASLQKKEIAEVGEYVKTLHRTNRITVQTKNSHRTFWGLKPVKVKTPKIVM